MKQTAMAFVLLVFFLSIFCGCAFHRGMKFVDTREEITKEFEELDNNKTMVMLEFDLFEKKLRLELD